MSDTDQRPPSTPDRPAAVEELMALLEECHAELARDGTISPTLIDAPGEIERLVDEALDSQLGEREREQLRKHIEEQGQSTDTALRAVLRDEEGRKRADGDTLIGDGGLPDHIGRINGFGDGPDWYRCQECGATGATLDTIDHREQCPSERRAVADGGEERVWVRSATDGKSRTHYHTDQDCHALNLANDIVREPLAVLADDIQECRRCAGSATRPSGGPSTTVSDRLKAMDPGDLDSLLDGGPGPVTDGGLPEKTHLDDDGLWIPPAFRGEAQLIIRTPRATIQHWGGFDRAYYGMVDESHFGDLDGMLDPRNPDLAPDSVRLTLVDGPAAELAVDTSELDGDSA